MLNPAKLYLNSLDSDASQTTMGSNINSAIALIGEPTENLNNFDFSILHYSLFDDLKAILKKSGKSPSTINTYLSAMKGVAKHARKINMISVDEYQNIMDVKSSKGTRKSKGRSLELDELNQILDSCMLKDGPINMRDAALIALTYGAGLRRSEAAVLQLSAYQPKNAEITVIGKGDKERTNPLNDRVVDILECWLDERGRQPGPLFCRIYKGGKISFKPITGQTVYDVIIKRYKESGLKRLTPHDLRKTYCTNLLAQGHDLFTVQSLMGHSSLDTTKIYDKRDKSIMIKAVKSLPL